jgi:hypothetical protein
MGKVIKKGPGKGMFAEGGKTKMFGAGHAAPAEAGATAHESQPGSDGKFAEGGKTKMFGVGHARTAEAGVSTKNSQ